MSRTRLTRVPSSILTLLTVSLLTGCAVGNKHAYHGISPETSTTTEKSVAVGSVDQRHEVLSGDITPDFVGMQRGGFGNPFDVLTASGNALSTEFSSAIKVALEKNGVNVVSIDTQPEDTDRVALSNLVATHRDRLLLLSIREWESDTYQNTSLRYSLHLLVADSSGTILARKSLKADLHLGGSLINPPSHAKAVVPPAFQKVVEELLSAAEVASALR